MNLGDGIIDSGDSTVSSGSVMNLDAAQLRSYSGSGTVWFDLSNTGNSGSLINGPTFSAASGGAIVLDRTNDYVSVGDKTSLRVGSFTINAWYRPSSFSGFNTIIAKPVNGPPWTSPFLSYMIRINASGSQIECSTSTGGTYRSMALTYTSSINTTNNICYTFHSSSGAAVMYLNGVAITSSTFPAGNTTFGAFPVLIGASYGASPAAEYFGGDVYNVRLYNTVLSATQVKNNFDAVKSRFGFTGEIIRNGLQLYWDVSNPESYPGSGSIIYDLSGNSNTGSIVGGVTYSANNGGVLGINGATGSYIISNRPDLRSTNYTVIGGARYSGSIRGRMINGTGNNWLLGHWNNSVRNYYAEGWVSPTGVATGGSDTLWRIYTGTGNIAGDSYAFYTEDFLRAGPNNGGSAGPNGISVGRFATSSQEFTSGQFSFVLVYNRILTRDEIQQTVNIFRSRFDI